ncbi:DUF7528 family protein [Haloarchaeobius sp. DYHT-AS-18]|uniref:DUF7528 family protein n=1 Tax=Haloarchaeobius sp. DYHT-AS-18 TaxID=3446117 RepID=UPI003EBBFE33
MSVTAERGSVVVELGDQRRELTRAEAAALQERIGDAMVEHREFFRTASVHRADGSYEVTRRAADSAGNTKVFESFAALERLYERLPDEFGAEAVGRTGITGSRRHLLVRHLAEHPDFDCEITCRRPLTATKADQSAHAAEATAATGEFEEVSAD